MKKLFIIVVLFIMTSTSMAQEYPGLKDPCKKLRPSICWAAIDFCDTLAKKMCDDKIREMIEKEPMCMDTLLKFRQLVVDEIGICFDTNKLK